MKCSRRLFIVVGVAIFNLQTAQANSLFSDGFNYATPGALGGNINSGSGFKWGPGNGNLTIGNGNLTYPGLQDLGGNELSVGWGVSAGTATNGFANVTSGSIYYSFLIDCTTAPSAQYLTALNPGTTGPSGSSDALQVNVATATGGWKVGVRTPGASTTLAGTVLSLGTTYLVVVGYNFTTHAATLYLNPTAGGSQPAADVTITGNGTVTSIDNVGFKAQTTGNTGAFLIDNILIGTTWADVVTPAPEPATCVLAGFGMLGLVLARRMRR